MCDILSDVAAEGVAATMEAEGKGALGSALLQRPTDICLVAVEWVGLFAVTASPWATEVFAVSLESR